MRKITQREPSEKFKALVQNSPSDVRRSSVMTKDGVGEYIFIKTERLKPYEHQARKVFDEDSLKQLSETIKQHGIRQPLTVVKSEEEGMYKVISGERRLRAANLIQMEKVPCIILSDQDNKEEIALVENLQRVDLHPVELGEAYLALLSEQEKWGSVSALANKIGVSKQSISEKMVYAQDIPPVIKDYLIQNGIKSRILLRQLSKEKDLEMMKELVGLSQGIKNIFKKKNLLRSYVINGEVKVEMTNNYISKKEKESLRSQLNELLKSLS